MSLYTSKRCMMHLLLQGRGDEAMPLSEERIKFLNKSSKFERSVTGNRPKLRQSILLSPFFCIRVVTRGLYPHLIYENVERNLKTLLNAGLENFIIQVVTDKRIEPFPKSQLVSQLIIPTSYASKNGSLFKARALQFALEDENNALNHDDWIIHLDEETILTHDSVIGIVNFVCNGKHDFGQGVITYANDEVVNWMTTCADFIRVGDDLGKLQFQLSFLHKPIFNWKGSYVVSRAGAEKCVSFDVGPNGSVTEDCFFALVAYRDSYSFGFIQGEMWEKSPFTIKDFLKQRKRWIHGFILVTFARAIPIKYKLGLILTTINWILLPLLASNFILIPLFPLPLSGIMRTIITLNGACFTYMYALGAVRSLRIKKIGLKRYILCMIYVLLASPFNVFIEICAVSSLFFNTTLDFYIVEKQQQHPAKKMTTRKHSLANNCHHEKEFLLNSNSMLDAV